ncbi:MAG: pyruvate:ferredoxin (flavodoxin) oxidoreductase [Myxococcales bacterium]|nr:pyruvate:ferredoxin (flavodoxin) oxidoreductase [Myxococcales bacterium]
MTHRATIDGNEAAARIAYLASEVVAIYPITPASPMGELADQWSAQGQKNLWGTVPDVIEMQSEGGAAGAVHGALQAGALTTTFTASQGLLLMLPNMYKIAGELTPGVIHIAARSLATHALSIFCDHSDIMSARGTGYAILMGNSVQEAHDMALVAHAATLRARVPFMNVFDGFRTSHEVSAIETLGAADVRALLDDKLVREHRSRALTPDQPIIRGTAQNPDVFFQAREAINPYYNATPGVVETVMDAFFAQTGRRYRLFDYVGAPDAERVVVVMGSAAGAAEEAVVRLCAEGDKVGLVKVRLYRPFSPAHLLAVLPKTVRTIGVLDRTKEPGAPGEPLYLDVMAAVSAAYSQGKTEFGCGLPRVVGGRFGLSSKEFTPAMVKGVFDELANAAPRHDFTVGIVDDVTGLSLPWDPSWSTEADETVRALFYGLGADGTVGANKNTIKIIGGDTDLFAQGYFVYDSKKSGAMTVSHLRFGPQRIEATYLIDRANFVACHQFQFTERIDVLGRAMKGATFLLNSPWSKDEVWAKLPERMQRQIRDLELKFYVIDAAKLAGEVGMGRRINTIMQTCFFALSGVLPRDVAIDRIRGAIEKTYGKRGKSVVRKNLAAVDSALDHLVQVDVPADEPLTGATISARVSHSAPEFVRTVTAPIMDTHGDSLPVSVMPVDGTFPVGTTRFEKRNVGHEIPVWDEDICVQCGKCVLACPHQTIRAKVFDTSLLAKAPEHFKTAKPRWKPLADQAYSLQVAPEDCTGCGLCVEVCPVKNKREVRLKAINMAPQAPLRDTERDNWSFFESLPETDRSLLNFGKVKDNQLLQPLFEFSGACSGCGETPYLGLVSQLFGDRMLIANATGCSSIYGGNLPTTPWTTNADGRGPTWSNSLFEDNAEFGLGMRVAVDKQQGYARELVAELSGLIGTDLSDALLGAEQSTEAEITAQRERVMQMRGVLATSVAKGSSNRVTDLLAVADQLVDKSVWIVGGDGWAYDIGFGGLDHVMASGKNVNILVLDTEVYSNTGGQMSKATPRAAVAKFAAGGKPTAKKDLGLLATSYGNVYVARIAMGANDKQTIAAMREAESYPGTSLIIAYSHCIAHGYDMRHGMAQQELAVKCGHWPLFRYDPRRTDKGLNPMKLDSKAPSIPVEKYAYNETRYTVLARAQPEHAKRLMAAAQQDVDARWQDYERLAKAK